MATAEALAAADPPVALSGPSIDLATRELEHVLPPGIRVAFLRAREGDWEARCYDPAAHVDDDTYDVAGYGRSLGGAIRDLIAQLRDPVAAAARAAA